MSKPLAGILLTAFAALSVTGVFAEPSPVCRGLDAALAARKGARIQVGRALGATNEETSIYARLSYCDQAVWMYASASNRSENDSFDNAPLNAPSRQTDQKRMIAAYEAELNAFRSAWDKFVKKSGEISQEAGKLSAPDDPKAPLAPADKLKLFDLLIAKDGEPLDPAGEKPADAKSVQGGARFQELDAAAWDVLKGDLFKQHPEAKTGAPSPEPGKPLFANPKAFLEYVAKVDPFVKNDMEGRFKTARETLNKLNAKVKENGGSMDSIRQGLGRPGGAPAAGSPSSTGPAAPVVEQPKTMAELQKQLPARLDGAVLSQVFEGMKQRNELPAGQDQQQWESSLSPAQRAKLLEEVRGREGKFFSYKGTDGKEYHRFSDGTTVAGDRLEVPEGKLPDAAQADAWVKDIARDLIARKDIRAVLGGVRQAAGEVAAKPGAAVGEAAKQGAGMTVAGLPVEANTQKELEEKSKHKYAKEAAQRSRDRQKATAAYGDKVSAAKAKYEAAVAAAKDPGKLMSPEARTKAIQAAEDEYKKAVAASEESLRTSYTGYQQAETNAAGRQADDAKAIAAFYRTEVSRQIKEKLVPKYKNLKAAQEVHPALADQSYLDRYISEEWTDEKKLDEKVGVLAQRAKGDARTGVRESDVDSYFRRDLRRWVDAQLRGQGAYTPPATTVDPLTPEQIQGQIDPKAKKN